MVLNQEEANENDADGIKNMLIMLKIIAACTWPWCLMKARYKDKLCFGMNLASIFYYWSIHNFSTFAC